ncbi:MAG: hypothetical protein FWD83_07025 [Promicromonosporaceae bacterium]|nr:hypothetical protein [Promicromonosporaceae bacterium]
MTVIDAKFDFDPEGDYPRLYVTTTYQLKGSLNYSGSFNVEVTRTSSVEHDFVWKHADGTLIHPLPTTASEAEAIEAHAGVVYDRAAEMICRSLGDYTAKFAQPVADYALDRRDPDREANIASALQRSADLAVEGNEYGAAMYAELAARLEAGYPPAEASELAVENASVVAPPLHNPANAQAAEVAARNHLTSTMSREMRSMRTNYPAIERAQRDLNRTEVAAVIERSRALPSGQLLLVAQASGPAMTPSQREAREYEGRWEPAQAEAGLSGPG